MAAPDTTSDQRVALPAYSMFTDTPIYKVGDDVMFGLLQDSVIPDPTDRIYVLTQAGEHRLDAVSTLFYGTPSLWWVIAIVNRILDPLLGVPFGTELRIPTKQRLSAEGILNS